MAGRRGQRIRDAAPAALAVAIAVTWAVATAWHRAVTAASHHRSEVKAFQEHVHVVARAQAHGRQADPWPRPVAPDPSAWTLWSVHAGLVALAVALLGLALVRVGHRRVGIAMPVVLAALPLTWGDSLLSALLLPTEAHVAVSGLWPVDEFALQAALLAAPAALAVLTWPPPTDDPGPLLGRPRPSRALAASRSATACGTVVVMVALLGDPFLAAGYPDRVGRAAVFVAAGTATGLLVARARHTVRAVSAVLAWPALQAAMYLADPDRTVAGGMPPHDVGAQLWHGYALMLTMVVVLLVPQRATDRRADAASTVTARRPGDALARSGGG